MRHRPAGVIALLLWAIFPCWVSSLRAEIPLPITEHTLQNGLRILVVERHESPVFSAHIRVRVGSVNDPPGFTGMAHLIEHMMFKGTRAFGSSDSVREEVLLKHIDALEAEIQTHETAGLTSEESIHVRALRQERARLEAQARRFVIPNEMWETYRRNGGTNINAVTLRDSTQYYVSLPKNRFELWALLESDRMRNPVFREFLTEKDVIQEEYRNAIETNPSASLLVRAYTAAFTSVPYGYPIWGWPTDRQRITRPAAQAFAASFYVPNNILIVLAGDLDPKEVVSVVERYFGSLPARPLPVLPALKEPEQNAQRRMTLEFPAEPQLAMVYQAPPFGPETDILSLVASLLVNGRSSRLHKRLVEEQRIATAVSSDTSWFLRYASLFSVIGIPRAPHTLDELESGIRSELHRVSSELISDDELERVQNQAELALANEVISNSGMASQLARMWDLAGDWRALFSRADRIRAVRPESLRTVAQRYLTDNRSTVAWLIRSSSSPSPLTSPYPATPSEIGDSE